MLSINTNLSSLIAQNSMNTSTNKLNQAIERMTTGAKINHAKDNAANYSINTNMTTKISAYDVAADNVAMGMDMVSTISENLELIDDHAKRIRDLCEQASNGTYGEQSLKAIQSEIDARLTEIERIKANAEYNGIKLFEGEEADSSDGKAITGSFIANIDQLTPDEAIAQGYTIIRTADELQAMKDNTSGKYILMNDINLENYNWEPISRFTGELNGNGYVIKNLVINNPSIDHQALFSMLEGTVKNLGIENASIKGKNCVGILAAYCTNTNIENVYVTGKIEAEVFVGGLVADAADTGSSPVNISNCYADINISAKDQVGGLVGYNHYSGPTITNCYSKGVVTGNSYVGGLVGGTNGIILSDSYTTCAVTGTNYYGTVAGLIYPNPPSTNVYYLEQGISAGNISGLTPIAKTAEELQALVDNGTLVSAKPPVIQSGEKSISLQVGINSDSVSQIKMSLESLKALEAIDVTSSDSARSALTTLDDYINSIGKMQTNIGSVTNRLDSVLEEITIQHDNLVASRSTIRDADMAELSSTYIQQQILQEATATLMATANQSPAIALQLI